MWIEEQPNGKFKYIERYTDPYTEKYKKVSTTLTSDSRRAWNEAQRTLNNKIDEKLKKAKQSDVTFAEITEKWHKVYKNTVKPSTELRARHSLKIIKRYISGDVLIRNIDTNYIQEMLDSIYYEENYSYSSTKQCKTIITAIFKFAKKRGFIETNPTFEVEIKKKPKTFEEVQRVGNFFLEHDELAALIKTQRGFLNGKRNSDLTEFLSLTGMRYGEAASLKYENFNDTFVEITGTLEYHTNKNSEGVITTAKTKSSYRKVDLSNRCIEILNEIILENTLMKNEYDSKFVEKGFLFSTVFGNPKDIGDYNGSLKNAAHRCGINKKISSHILRHTHISLLAEIGIPLKAIMDRVGHANPETTLKIYTHVTKNMQNNLIEKLNKIEETLPL